ncbi:hypothetical protein V6N12_033269 [Hibiscus sabdariffa]|uniref:Aconitase/3-isopropylmalate dehydratase large subunit alpha/beta/alpha domain-containing protein n=1 Tax=Hibiscus sabdariffa TaxID=183260 RepID=A0ABR2BAD3_9ROSI
MSVAIVAITSCTSTSNPSVMLGTCLVTKKAYEFGLQVKSWIKINLTPGLGVVTKYLFHSGLHKDSNKKGFNISGYSCTCIGNSGDLDESVANAISRNGITTTFKEPSETSKDGKSVEKSETSAIVEKIRRKGDLNLIGQFKVGFYFVYLLADYVEVVNIHSDVEQYMWKLEAGGAFVIFKDAWNELFEHVKLIGRIHATFELLIGYIYLAASYLNKDFFHSCCLTMYLEKIAYVDDANGANFGTLHDGRSMELLDFSRNLEFHHQSLLYISVQTLQEISINEILLGASVRENVNANIMIDYCFAILFTLFINAPSFGERRKAILQDLDVQIHVVQVVANLVIEEENQQKIVEAGGLKPLLMFLGSSKVTIDKIAKCVVGAKCNEAQDGIEQKPKHVIHKFN